ncbi:MAG: hypothetical protein HQ477_04430 [Chloroflexi bacterium]|nr:hypothetical protein [Chloroflexota bacterium]
MADSVFSPQTAVTIDGDNFLINGIPTLQGRTFRGVSIEGLMLNSRMANAMFDDENKFTRHLWAYENNDRSRAGRNTDELIEMLPTYYAKGLTCIDINLQGASPLGYYRSDEDGIANLMKRIHAAHPTATKEQIWAGVTNTESQPWISGAFTESGDLKPAFMDRTARIIEAADSIGMVVCLGYFYFGQDERLKDEDAVKSAVDKATKWVLESGYTNVLIEINNEADAPRYEHDILCPPRVHELIERAAAIEVNGKSLLVSTSFTRRMVPTDAVIAASDYILLHGNGMHDPAEITKRVIDTRASTSFRGQPIFFNEDDHFDFENESNNFASALEQRVGWGYFDPGLGAGGTAAYGDYVFGYQNPPINWTINTQRKESFFWFLSEVTGSN